MMNAAVLVLSMVAAVAPTEADVRAVAALPGEPRIVSAAGVLGDETPVLTLENPDAFDPASTKRRAVVFASGSSDAASAAVIRMVRWFKTTAPQALRDQWSVSALPAAGFDAGDEKSLTRWMTFQAPDVAIEVVDGSSPPIGPGNVDAFNGVIRLPAQDDALGRMLRTAQPGRSPVHETLFARIQRDPLAIARVLAMRYPETPGISYIPAVAWMQTLRLADVATDSALREKVRQQTRPWIAGERTLFSPSPPALAQQATSSPPASARQAADRVQLTSVAGTMIFAQLATLAGSSSAEREAAGRLADEGATLAAKEKAPATPEYGQGWTDDMFMATSILARTTARPGHERDLDTAARLLVEYATRLQRPDGLFNHAVSGPAAWGRGNGFAAMGLMEALTTIPESHPARAALLDILRRQMAVVRANQAPDGAFRQIVDEPGAYREETATAMLMSVMARGIRLGWLDRSYVPIVQRAWRALAAHVTADGALIDVCAGTGAGPTRRYYFDRPAVTGGDDRGGAMALLASMEMHELAKMWNASRH